MALTAQQQRRLGLRLAAAIAATEPVDFTKAQLKNAVEAVDVFLDGQAAALDAALPTAFRNRASAKQKALLLQLVAENRYEVI